MQRLATGWFKGSLILALLTAASAQTQQTQPASTPSHTQPTLELVAQFPDRQVTGVAVSPTGRIFVCFPYWSDTYQGALAELAPDGSLRDYPDDAWNAWRIGSELDPATHFVCVQSVIADRSGNLWVLDPAAPSFQGPVPNGPKLVRIDLRTNRVAQIIPFDPQIAPPGSYLNDVRIDETRQLAYITDSGRGAIIVVDLKRQEARRVLETHPSTHAEDIEPTIAGKPLRDEQGRVPQIHADGIALSPDGEYLYYHALTGYRLYRVPTQALRALHDQPELLAMAVENLGPDVVCDGMLMDEQGDLYLTALEHHAIAKRSPRGELTAVVQDPRLRWPDTLALGPDRWLYVTVSQIHLMPRFNEGRDRVTEPWALYRLKLPAPTASHATRPSSDAPR
ncbi:MAG TPA: L-dopachrome tautomerase-related protein [Phycisphaeraceae bacterium]